MQKTPEEIKKGLEVCAVERGPCKECPYRRDNHGGCIPHKSSDALAYIQRLEAQVPKWISVEERLPENGRYLVLTQKDGSKKAHTATFNEFGWWTYADFGEITHWMELPEWPLENRRHEPL